MNVDQATGLCGGMDVPSGAKPPLLASRAKPGRRPRVDHLLGELVVEAVEAEDDDLAAAGGQLSRHAAAAESDGNQRERPIAPAASLASSCECLRAAVPSM